MDLWQEVANRLQRKIGEISADLQGKIVLLETEATQKIQELQTKVNELEAEKQGFKDRINVLEETERIRNETKTNPKN
jgi:cell division protein FtsL